MADFGSRSYALPSGRIVTIRGVVPDDAPGVLTYVEAICAETTFLSFGPGEFGYSEMEERTRIHEFRDTANQLALIAVSDEAIVAMLTFIGGRRPRNQHTGDFGLSVRHAYWGDGIGGLLLDTLIVWAKTSGVVTKINLRVRTDNARAIALYERKGFVHEGTMTRDLFVDGAYYDHHLMGLTV